METRLRRGMYCIDIGLIHNRQNHFAARGTDAGNLALMATLFWELKSKEMEALMKRETLAKPAVADVKAEGNKLLKWIGSNLSRIVVGLVCKFLWEFIKDKLHLQMPTLTGKE